MSEEQEDNETCVACGSGFDSADELQEALEENNSSEQEEDTTRIDFKVYDVPIELKNKYVSLAKLEYDNQMWKVLEAGMDRLVEERETQVPKLEKEVDSLQKQIVYLKKEIEELKDAQRQEEPDEPVTFGSQREEVDKEDEEILNRFQS